VLRFKTMQRPTIARLPGGLRDGARHVAGVLSAAGHHAYLVGGAVRDLALGLEPADADLATSATPDEIERLFPSTHAVGKAFGTVVVHEGQLDFQVTTFRTEAGYHDARRPAEVRFGRSVEEDAARRDFTCNALYLHPLTDEVLDPTGGLADLDARRLRCVGQPDERFAEDGLRLLRLARLAAHFGLEVEPETMAGAARAVAAIRGVSAERVLAELERMAAGPAPGRALALLREMGVLPLLPGTRTVLRLDPQSLEARAAAVAALGPACGSVRFLGALLRPSARVADPIARDAVLELRPSRALLDGIVAAWALEPELERCFEELTGDRLQRSRWLRLVRAPAFEDALALWTAWNGERRAREIEVLRAKARELGPEQLFPRPVLSSDDLAQAGIPRGPRWSELLREAEQLQLDGELSSAEDARAWLARRTRER